MNRLVRQLISPFLTEQVKAKRVIAIYPGRFQPFGPHHRKVFQNLQSKFGKVYITTSGIKQPPRHPMNFKEKVRHMVKMGIPKNRIVKERVPYVANNLLKKFKDDTAVVYVFGAKDAGRLKGGKKKSGGLTYYQDYNKNKGNLLGYKEHGYIYTAPTVKVSGITSGTEIRNLLGSSKMERSKREKLFQKTFGYFDKGIFNMLTNKFRKLTEEKQFKAKSKETGRVVIFKSKENMDNAIKTGRAEPLDKKDDKAKGKNLFNKKQDNWEKLDDKSNRVKVGNYTDEQYKEETGEYFDNKKTMGIVPNAFKDKNDMIKKMKSARSVYLKSNKMEFMDNTDVGDILKSDNALELGKQKAQKYGKDWNRLEKAIKGGKPVPPPIAMKDKNGDYYLLAGNTRLMSYTASGKKLPIKVINYDGEFQYNESIHECIAFSKKFGDDIVIGKNRDRNYTPELKVVKEISGNGIEVCYVQDQDTDWSEGMNSNGIGLVNSALFVKRDEKDFDKAKKKKAPSKDGIRIRHALSKDTFAEVVKSLVKFDTGVKGHTLVSNGKKLVVIENTSRTKPSIKIHDIDKSSIVRTNHGIKHPEQGYTRGPDRISSELRLKNAKELIDNEKEYKKVFPLFYNDTQDKGPKFDLVRAQNKLWTSSQILMNLNKKQLILYLIPGAVKFIGIENKLPKNYRKLERRSKLG